MRGTEVYWEVRPIKGDGEQAELGRQSGPKAIRLDKVCQPHEELSHRDCLVEKSCVEGTWLG